jgi:hypothetical protein
VLTIGLGAHDSSRLVERYPGRPPWMSRTRVAPLSALEVCRRRFGAAAPAHRLQAGLRARLRGPRNQAPQLALSTRSPKVSWRFTQFGRRTSVGCPRSASSLHIFGWVAAMHPIYRCSALRCVPQPIGAARPEMTAAERQVQLAHSLIQAWAHAPNGGRELARKILSSISSSSPVQKCSG